MTPPDVADMARRINVALVGTGGFAREHLAALTRNPQVRVTHIVGSDARHTREFAACVPTAIPTTRLADALEDAMVDAVDVCNASPSHAPSALAAVRAGKHVHVDKPAALTVEDFDQVVAAAEESGVSVMVGQTVRFQPIIARLRQAMVRGEIGEPRLLHVSWYTGHVWPNAWRGWQMDPVKSGGHPVHNGTHILDLAVWLMGSEPVEVFTRSFRSWAAQMPIPDSFTTIVRFANGSLATLELCYALRGPGESLRRVVLAGTEGTLMHDTSADPGLTASSRSAMPASLEGALDAQLAHWVRALLGSEPFLVRNDEVRQALAAAIAAQQSLVTERPVAVHARRRS